MMMRLLICFIPCLFRVVNGFQPLSTGIIEMRGGRNVARRSPLFRAEAPTSPSLESEQLSVPTLSKFDPVNWTPKRLHNSRLFRSAAILGALALAGYSTKAPLTKISTRASATINILSFGTWFGTVVYTTFVAGITMYKNLPRQTFGKLQARLFPKYFSLCSITILLQLLTLRALSSVGQRATIALATALVCTLLNQFWLEPVSSDTMYKRYELEDTPNGKDSDEYKKLAAAFGKYHGLSSLTNLISLCAAVAQGTYLASALVP
jgi:hypothetical protein